MKLYVLSFTSMLLLIASCSSDENKFSGVWQSINDPSRQIIFTHSGKAYSVETRNIKSTLDGLTGTYDAKAHALEFDHGNGESTKLVYNDDAKHIVGLGEEFEKTTNAVVDNKEGGEATEKTTEETPAETSQPAASTAACDKGDILIINGNNVRLRNEPDVTKQNILMQVHKGYEVVRISDKTVDGQKWYKVCYEGNIGWVSGQYAVKK